jgi:hypothetical protein
MNSFSSAGCSECKRVYERGFCRLLEYSLRHTDQNSEVELEAIPLGGVTDPPPLWTASADFPFDWSTATNQNPERSLTSFKFYRDKVPHKGEITFTVQGFTLFVLLHLEFCESLLL